VSDLNQVTLIGRLTRDAEVRHTKSGDPVYSLRLAVNSRAKEGDGWTDKPGFFDVVHFGRSEKLAEYLVKGKQIGLSGRLSHREWVDREGGKRQTVEVIANDLFLLGGKESSGGGGSGDETPF
jgi:single-strand DNA-binding protein